MILLLKKPSAWIPILMPVLILAMMLGYFIFQGIPQHQQDEGTGAHLFQLWFFILEPVSILYFLAKWVPKSPRQALQVFVLQIIFSIAACAPVFLLNL